MPFAFIAIYLYFCIHFVLCLQITVALSKSHSIHGSCLPTLQKLCFKRHIQCQSILQRFLFVLAMIFLSDSDAILRFLACIFHLLLRLMHEEFFNLPLQCIALALVIIFIDLLSFFTFQKLLGPFVTQVSSLRLIAILSYFCSWIIWSFWTAFAFAHLIPNFIFCSLKVRLCFLAAYFQVSIPSYKFSLDDSNLINAMILMSLIFSANHLTFFISKPKKDSARKWNQKATNHNERASISQRGSFLTSFELLHISKQQLNYLIALFKYGQFAKSQNLLLQRPAISNFIDFELKVCYCFLPIAL